MIPCETCGKPTPYKDTKRCDNCWEFERRFADYLNSKKGLAFIINGLMGNNAFCDAEMAALRDRIVTPDPVGESSQPSPLLDDWVDGHPDAWDYNAVLRDNSVLIEYCDTLTDGWGCKSPAGVWAGWSFSWKHGVMFIGQVLNETIARKAAALFVSLWLRGVSASFADKLMDGFITSLERQETTSLSFLAEICVKGSLGGRTARFFLLTHEPLCTQAALSLETEEKIIKALDPQPDEEIIVTFTKRKK